MTRKISSYQKLKNKYDGLYKLYHNARKRLHNLGQGIDGNDILFNFDMELGKTHESQQKA